MKCYLKCITPSKIEAGILSNFVVHELSTHTHTHAYTCTRVPTPHIYIKIIGKKKWGNLDFWSINNSSLKPPSLFLRIYCEKRFKKKLDSVDVKEGSQKFSFYKDWVLLQMWFGTVLLPDVGSSSSHPTRFREALSAPAIRYRPPCWMWGHVRRWMDA